MTEIEKLKRLKETMEHEDANKRRARRQVNSCFIPRCYFVFGITKKDLFKRELTKALRRVNSER